MILIGRANNMSLFTNIEEVESQEFCWSSYQQEVIEKYKKDYESLEQAIVVIDAEIQSMQSTINALRELVNWESE